MIDTIELCTFWQQSNWPWPWFKVTGVRENKNFCINYLPQFSIELDGITFSWDFLVWWTTYSFSLVHLVFKGENPTCYFLLENFNVGLYSDIYRPISFKLGMVIAITSSTFWYLDDLDLYSRSQLCQNQKVWCPFSQKFLCWFGWNVVCCRNQLVGGSAC